MELDKVDLEFEETVKVKPTGNDSGFINYSNTINFASKWLDNSGYLINQWQRLVKEQVITWLKKLGRTKNVIKVGKISEKYDMLTIEEKIISYLKYYKISLEMTPSQSKLEARKFKASNIQIDKLMKYKNNYCEILVGKYILGYCRWSIKQLQKEKKYTEQ